MVKPAVAPNTGVRDVMAGSTTSVKGSLYNLITPLLPKIFGELTRGGLIEIY